MVKYSIHSIGICLQVLRRIPNILKKMEQWVMALPLMPQSRSSSGGGGGGGGDIST